MNQSLRTVAIKGGYGLGNFGDDALMVAAYEIAKRVFGSQSIVLLCHDASYIQRLIPGAKVVSISVADILLYGGGTQFYSFQLSKAGRIGPFSKIVRNLKKPDHLVQKMYHKLRQALVHLEFSPKQVAIGIGLGPFVENSHELSRAKKLFTRMDFVTTRDIYSYNLCKTWGTNNLSLCSDLCYLPDLWKACLSNCSTGTTSSIKKVGVIVRDWPHSYEGQIYAAPLFKVVSELRRGGKKVGFICFSKRNDSGWIKRLEDKHEYVTVWNPERDSISSFLGLLSGYDVFITARYHGAVFASIIAKPTVCIEIEQKLALVSELLGDGARLWTYPFKATDCMKHIEELERKYSMAVRFLDEVVETQSKLAGKMVNDIELFIRGKYTESQYDCR